MPLRHIRYIIETQYMIDNRLEWVITFNGIKYDNHIETFLQTEGSFIKKMTNFQQDRLPYTEITGKNNQIIEVRYAKFDKQEVANLYTNNTKKKRNYNYYQNSREFPIKILTSNFIELITKIGGWELSDTLPIRDVYDGDVLVPTSNILAIKKLYETGYISI
jgi:hypothetical protein